eukprot:1648119-Pleurochrysis_carterae.AAC.1
MHLRSSTRVLVGLARAVHRADQIIHDRAISILSYALDPLLVARTVASYFTSRSASPVACPTAHAAPHAPLPAAPPRQRAPIAR